MTNEELREEFYKQFTDEVDEQNDYYDSQFTEGRPSRVFNFLLSKLDDLRREIRKEVEEMQVILPEKCSDSCGLCGRDMQRKCQTYETMQIPNETLDQVLSLPALKLEE